MKDALNREHPMANTPPATILNYLRQVLGAAAAGGVSDAELLRRFAAERDEAAFELLLWRHAAMVRHVCRQVLGDGHDADDAFQATFLVFVRKAGSIGRREALGSWLYRVAYRIALKARARAKKHTASSAELDRLEAPAESDNAEQRDLRRIVCEEVNRLPAKYRAPIVACFFEGKTHEEAAHQLGWPRGTVAGRLARARDLLRRRLLRRGVTLTVGALVTALSVRTAQAALTGLVDSVIHTARQLAAGQAASAVVSPHVAALAEGVLQTMIGMRMKIVVAALFVTSLGGAGATLWSAQQREAETTGIAASQARGAPILNQPRGGGNQEEDYEEPEEPPAEAKSPEEAAKLARDMALSRLNLKKLALAMHNYADTFGHLPLAAKVKNGKALLSWRVELLPYMEEHALYMQFKRDEPWDSPHNKKLLSKMPAVFAPPGVKTRRPYSTFYQVFVSAAAPRDGEAPAVPGGTGGGAAPMPGGPGGPTAGMMPGGGGAPARRGMGRGGMRPQGGSAAGGPGGFRPGGPAGGMGGPGGMQGMAPAGGNTQPGDSTAAFVKGEATRFPAHFTDGTANTILIVEAGNPVPWTKPEDLHYAEDEPLPELGGLFADAIHAAFADGSVHTLTPRYNEKQLRYAITVGDGMPLDWSKIQGRLRRTVAAPGERAPAETWQRKNNELRKDLELVREQIRLLKEEQEVQRELAGEDPRVRQLKEEHARMQTELKKLRAEVEALKKDIRRPR